MPLRALFLNTAELLDRWWDGAEPHLQRVVSGATHGEFLTQDIYALVKEGRMHLAIVLDVDSVVLAMAFEFVLYPRMTACNIVALGGSRLKEIEAAFFVAFRDWCKSAGITVIEASCSSSMSEKLRRFGFEKTYEVVRYELLT